MAQSLLTWALAVAATAWIFPIVTAFAALDALVPPIPSETLIIAVASLAISADDGGRLVPLAVAGALGAIVGDVATYWLGRRADPGRLRILRTRRGAATLAWAGRTLDRRGAPLILGGRYVPVGRVAVNVTAGATGYPFRRFVLIDVIAAVSWAIYACVIGAVSGSLIDNPIWAVVVGCGGGLVLGLAVEQMVRIVRRMRGRRGAGPTGRSASVNPVAEADHRSAVESLPGPAGDHPNSSGDRPVVNARR